ncbi:S-adenosyl-L-methionine-dependent methyltransferase [Bisporella sp. PMI_857]|nr:S-adenosyl-L-methionine-dependent methyltransferase [Bisporella sp. PMI_857]
MKLPTQEGLRSILLDLTAAIDSYSTAPDLQGNRQKKLITPEQLPNYHGLNMAEVLAIRTFIKLNVHEAVPVDGAISLQELPKKTGAAESLLERMARILARILIKVTSSSWHGFLGSDLPDGGDYKHTRFSISYPTSQPGPGQLFLSIYDEWFKNMHNFDDYLVDRGQLGHAQEPSDPLRNSYTWTHKQDGTPVIQTFQVGMSGLDIAIPPTGHFDFNSLAGDGDAIQLIDVGGGHGVVLKQIIDVHTALNPAKCVLQERPDVIEMARASKALPESAEAYFLRMILYDYGDSVGIAILSHLAAAMSPTSRVLICEIVIPQRVSESDFASAVLDQAVMTIGGKERTQKGFEQLFKGAGLELVEVWRYLVVTPGACVEARLKR